MRRHVRGGMRPCPCATGCLSRVDSARCSRRGPLLTAPAARVVRYRYTCAHVDVRGRGGQNGRLSRRLESILSHASYVASLVGYPIGTFSAFISQVYMNYIFRFCTVDCALATPQSTVALHCTGTGARVVYLAAGQHLQPEGGWSFVGSFRVGLISLLSMIKQG
jgi:hypothetical protein